MLTAILVSGRGPLLRMRCRVCNEICLLVVSPQRPFPVDGTYFGGVTRGIENLDLVSLLNSSVPINVEAQSENDR